MVKNQEWVTIQNLLQADLSIPQIANRLGRSPNTVYKLIKNNGPKNKSLNEYTIPPDLKSFEEYIKKRVTQGVSNSTKLRDELRERGYAGPYYKVNAHVRLIIKRKKLRKYKPSKRFETEPGQQAQVDWGHCGSIEINGKRENLYCFSYILGYSRMRFLEFTIRQNIPTLIECHLGAFERLGIPREIVYDNMTTIVSKIYKLPDGSFKRQFTSIIADLSKHFGYEIKPTAPYWPRAKGKVESSIKYIKGNFMQGLRIGKGLKGLEELNEKASEWVNTIANSKLHSSTKEIPRERYIREKVHLLFPEKFPPYNTFSLNKRFSSKDASVEFKSCAYPIPEKFSRRWLVVKEVNEHGVSMIEIYAEEVLLAKYYVAFERHKWVNENEAIFFKNAALSRDITSHKVKTRKAPRSWPKVKARPISYYNNLILED